MVVVQPVTPALERFRQEDREFKFIRGCIVSSRQLVLHETLTQTRKRREEEESLEGKWVLFRHGMSVKELYFLLWSEARLNNLL